MQLWKLSFAAGLCLLINVGSLKAQPLLEFYQPSTGKVIPVKAGDQLSISYRGYLGQTELFKSALTQVTDSSVILGLGLLKPERVDDEKVRQALMSKEILLSDIIAFRRMSTGRVLLKSVLTTGAVVGSVLLLSDLYRNSDYTDLQKLGISVGTGIGINIAIQMLLPEHPKYRMSGGNWKVRRADEIKIP